MANEENRTRSPVRRDGAEGYLLTSLVAFAVTVILTRVYLHVTGFPQLGNSVLHIAHALWGGLALWIAVLLPLAFANRWALSASALLSGIGVGLFIDEVGKFITQANDYFFAPALSIVYAFVLLNVIAYLHFRRPQQEDARSAMYHALEGLRDALDGDLDVSEAARIEEQLNAASLSDRGEISKLASALSEYLQSQKRRLSPAVPGLRKRVARRVDALGLRLGRRRHRTFISGLLVMWVVFVLGYIALLLRGGPSLDSQVLQWRGPLIAIQAAVGSLMIVAVVAWLTGDEERGLTFAIGGSVVSLVALQLLYFYLSQFYAVTATLLQLGFLQVLLAYRRWYPSGPPARD